MTTDTVVVDPDVAAIERRVAFHLRATREAEGVGYLIARIDAGDNRLDQADDEAFAVFYADHDGTRLNAAALYEQFIAERIET